MYKEIKKYDTGKIVQIKYDVIGSNGEQVTLPAQEYKGNLGDLVNDLITHRTKPRWKRQYNHNYVTELYVKMLSRIEFISYI